MSDRFAFARHAPAPDLALWIGWYWVVRWDLRGEPPRIQETIPHPSVNVVFEQGKTRVFGVATRKFRRELRDSGLVFGIKFRPGAFQPFFGSSVAELTDSERTLLEVFGLDDDAVESAMLSCGDDPSMIAVADELIRSNRPRDDVNVATVIRMVEYVIDHRDVTRVEQIASAFGYDTRALQRTFNRYVGVSPKWVIRRYRLQEAAEQLSGGNAADWTRLALDLGYFDQPHFINDFRSLIGLSPAEYARRVAVVSIQ
ncbi:MAG: helix-turn-helix domain-containing protein [Gemmatimonadota bacterium]|nr:helix-turn-helix domain-containing protein [Gemmatimonadota bacterium]